MRRSPPGRAPSVLGATALAAAIALAGPGAAQPARTAELVAEQELPADVRAEVDARWADFVAVFGSRARCFRDVSLLLVDDVEGGDARYVVDRARIEIAVPTSPARFRESLVHELAHHVEHTCPAFGELRHELAALPELVGRPWSGGDQAWSDTPAEHWAEAVVEVVDGRRVRHGRDMPLPDGATALVRAWASDG